MVLTDSRFQHPAHPAGDAGLLADVVDGQRVGQAAHPPGLDVHPAAGPQFDGLARPVGGDDALVQAYGRLDSLLQLGMVHQVVVGQGLLEHGQLVAIQRLKHGQVVQRVGAVTVDMESHVGKGPTDGGDHLQVPAGPVLEFDAPKAGFLGFGDLADQRIHRLHHPEIRAHLNIWPLAPEELPKGLPLSASSQVPPGQVQAALGEIVALDGRQRRLELFAALDLLADQPGGQIAAEHAEHGPGALVAIDRLPARCGLSPAPLFPADHAYQRALDTVLVAISRAERIDERHGDVIDLDTLNSHGIFLCYVLSASTTCIP